MYHSRVSSTSWRLAKPGSISANGMHVEGQVPGRVPGILPLVRHRDHVGVVEVLPLPVAAHAGDWPAAAAAQGRPSATAAHRSSRTAWTRSARRRPGAARRVHRLLQPGLDACIEARRPPPGAVRRSRRSPRKGSDTGCRHSRSRTSTLPCAGSVNAVPGGELGAGARRIHRALGCRRSRARGRHP